METRKKIMVRKRDKGRQKEKKKIWEWGGVRGPINQILHK